IPLGLTQPLRARATLTDGNTVDVTDQVAWSVDDVGVAEVSNAPGSEGLATSLAVGQTTVRATLPGGPQGSAPLTVVQAQLVSLDCLPDTDTLPVGECGQYFAIGGFSDGVDRDVTSFVTWTSSDENIAVVENFFPLQGRVFAEAVGMCNITATEPITGLTDSCPLTVTNAVLTDLTVDPVTLDLRFLQIRRLTATGIFSDGSTEDLTSRVLWSTSNPASAVVSNFPLLEGVVLAILPGQAIITASRDAISAQATVNVRL
ncbi:MAG: Ig-like domain-containing protein, partial [Candidatus Eremiobacterota bacterium]